MDALNPSAAIHEIDSIWEPTFCTATLIAPKLEIKRAMYIEMHVNNILCTEDGNPIFNISEMWFNLGFDKIRIFLNRSRFFVLYKKTRVTMIWARIVARAAPMTLRLNTKMSTGSKIKFNTRPVVVAIKVLFECPAAVRIPVKIWFTKENTIKPHVIHK